MGSVLYLDGRLRRHARVELLRKEKSAAREEPRAGPRSLLRLGYNCWAIARAERAAFIVDAKDYFEAFYRAALLAKRSIIVLGWDFNSQTRLHYDPVPKDGPPAVLGDFLNYLTKRRRGLHIHVLTWDFPVMFAGDREVAPIFGLGWEPGRRVHFRYDDAHPVGASQHQKVAVIDDAMAFVGGIDLTLRRWDCCDHAPQDPRRTAEDQPYPPFHDTMIALDGEAAHRLAEMTRERWRLATGQRLKPLEPDAQSDPWPAELEPHVTGVDVGIARTLPPRGELPAVREVEKLYLDMIAAARRTIYIENQYFTAPRLAAALEKRLAEPDGPEVVLVLRLLSHGWLEEATMHVLRTRLIQKLQQADRHGRFRVYYPHVPGLAEGKCIDVHSKVMVIDDAILRIGSANLCNRSMAFDTECDIVVESRGEASVAAAIGDFRDRLLAEHLDTQPARVREETERAGSVNGAIAVFTDQPRTLRQLDELPEWSETVLNVAAVADPEEPIALETLLSERHASDAVSSDKPSWGKLAGIVLAILALMALWRFTPLREAASAEAAIAWAKAFGEQPWAPWALMLSYTPACLVMFPRPLITLAAVLAFGPWLGFFYSLTGICASSAVTWYMGRHMRRDTVRRLAGPRLDRMVEVLKKHGLLAMTLLRLVPLAPFAVESIVAGAIRMKLWHVVAGTAIGLLPGTLTTTVFGDAIETAVSGSGEVNWWIVGGALALLAAGAWAVKRWFTRMERRMQAHGEAGGQPR